MLPFYVIYLLKLSLGLAAVFLFYRLVLQNLTFYQINRWFLLIGTAITFLIPLVNIGAWLEPKQHTLAVKFIPAVEGIARDNFYLVPAQVPVPSGYNFWDWLLLVLVSGSVLLLTRSVIQYFSFLQIKRRARLVSDQKIKIYQIDSDVTPFSFGRSIFLSASIKQEQDLQEIMRHEFVHVEQGHTADILWVELVCILNWFNPLAWLLRHQVRQNLEFIADNHVLQTGTDKKHYQYLLLQILGEPAFRLAHQFNFSPLKKRILMMNKIPSTRPHLAKFLFLLPLVATLLLSFRNIENSSENVAGNNFRQTDFDPKKDTPHIVGREHPSDNIVIYIFNDGQRVKYDLTTEAGKSAVVKAQKLQGDAYKPEDPNRSYDPKFIEFIKLNPQIDKISWRYDYTEFKNNILRDYTNENFISFADRIYFKLKSGEVEVFRLESKDDLNQIEGKYGKLPMLPPPPPTLIPNK